eukprot:CAMPEP_0195534132 /NCGR_PEP_ID=MMETSP0794_2-20130614/41866_1 /TAXON_ID=515487 /ORGANISM="Stephanopyxis turris, Strain CCMP 815" /LENGTH=66 /DNA_ID=CAMNT_0040666891 /DNA_START=496 /DNA_END=692 /DNA_ORIENTATION=+
MEVITLERALAMSKTLELDLVGVSLNQDIPVVKALNFAKMEYDAMKKKKKEAQLAASGPNGAVRAG